MASKLNIDVKVDGHYSSKTYTSGSAINGRVTIKATQDVAFDSVEVAFTGTAITLLNLNQQFISRHFRPFLKLPMPVADAKLPLSNIFEAGAIYTIPFNFVIPHRLTMGACNHPSPPQILEHHLRPPPTMGYWEGDDEAPERASIEYAVKVRVALRTVPKPIEGSQIIKLLPATSEDAPLDVSHQDQWYTLTNSTTIRKGMFFGKLGKLRATTTQPSAVMLRPDGREATPSSIRINLDFLPSSSAISPPKLGNVTGKLQSVTFFTAAPMDRLPTTETRTRAGSPCLHHSTTNTVFTVPAGDTEWKQSSSIDSFTRGGSGNDSSENDQENHEPNRQGGAPCMYTATLDIPFAIPISSQKILLPSFHNCLISRVYSLRINLSAGPSNTTVSLAAPLQVGVTRMFDPPFDEPPPSFESAMAQTEEEEADALLRPRVMSIASSGLKEDSELPGYGEARRS